MPLDSITFVGIQGDEGELQNRITTFLNMKPIKRIKHVITWSIGIHVYIMFIFFYGRRAHNEPKASPDYMTYMGSIGDY